MPEQPEVERAVERLRHAVVGRRILQVRVLHPALARALPPADADSLAGRTVVRVDRRGKHQLLVLDDGRTLHAHFRMAGDWELDGAGDALPPHARAVIELAGSGRVVLVDPRALATLQLIDAERLLATLGPDPADPAYTAAELHAALARRRGPIKPVLLDQRIVSGVGNIYAAEALWHARIDPRLEAGRLGARRVTRLLDGIRTALARGTETATRYSSGEPVASLEVYGREGEPCSRCGATIRRIVQTGRSTYYCPRCQRR